MVPWAVESLEYLDRRRTSGATGDCTLPELFRMTSLNAARVLGLDGRVGSLERGKQANLIVLNDDFSVAHTFLQGREVAL